MKITAHCLVKNEERYLWYAVMSVIEQIGKILIWDTGSEDLTLEIIKELKKKYPDKVDFRQAGEVTSAGYTKVRQEMLDKTNSDWLLILDGDEVWWEGSIKRVVGAIQKEKNTLETIVTPFYNVVGDIYHFQEEAAGRYEIDGRRGHLTIRTMNRRIPGLHTTKPHGQHGYFDEKDRLIQERSSKKRKYLDAHFMHFTHMIRSSSKQIDSTVPKRSMKLKYELGIPFGSDFYYPEVFFRPRPAIVPSPWHKMNFPFWVKALIETPARKIKRRVLPGKTGY